MNLNRRRMFESDQVFMFCTYNTHAHTHKIHNTHTAKEWREGREEGEQGGEGGGVWKRTGKRLVC